ncbi:hypothetical protein CUMW_156120, partial [Citrus unshiu]
MASEEVGDHAVCGTASESFFGSIKREISYVPKYQSHIDDLENQVKQLGCKRQRVENLVNAARRQGDEIYKGVEQWLISIDEFTQRVVKPIIDYQDEAKKHCFKGLCPNLLKRYNLSKEAAKAAKDGANLLGKGNFSNFCFRPAPQRMELTSSRLYQQFNSRRSIFRDIMVAMKDDEVNMIGVYGSGGVGKTTLVKAVARQVIEEKLFDEVVMVEVTRTPDQKPIQDKIASDLGLQFGQHDDVLQRAGLLSERLKKEKRVLIILDDIWMRLDLDGIGIPFWGNEKQSVRQQEDWKERYVDQGRCKILLTSRNQHVLCNEMNIQKTFSIGVLSDEEALSFFWSNVGDAAGRSDFLPIGVEIVRECRGFPIAIITIANALKNKILFFWKDAFDQLRNSNQRRMGGEDAKVNSIIELSYNFLESEEAKSLFRLCGLLNGGSQIPIDALMRCGMGLGLLKGVYTLQEARKRVHMLVNNLKASRLLLDGDAEECLKMHDIIHSIAASVATEELMFNMQNVADLKEELDKKTHKDPTAISIPFRGIYEFPERLECPKLKLFVLFSENLSLRIPDLFFEGMTELRVLSFTGFRFPSLPSSIGCLISLRTLTLESCLLGDVATIGDLKKLEILSLRHSDVEELPGEIGQLTRLKLLDLSNCMKLKVIRPNVISSLSRLEELYMGNSFTEWEIEGQSNASLVELKQLSRLTTLEVHIPDAQVMPQDLLSVELERYRICIGDVWSWSGEHETSRRLKLSALNKCIYLGYGMQMLLKGIEDLYLDELNGFQNALLELEDGEVFPLLKHLHVQNVCEILYIVNLVGWGHCNAFPLLESLFLHNLMRLEMVYHGQLTEHSFSKLRIIKVCQCDNLKHLFSFPMARNLLQLQKIKVSFCESLKLIVGKESSETHNVHEIINFTQLHSLTLQCLPQLTSSGFNLERPLLSPTISATTLAFEEVIAADDSDESLFNNKVIFPNLEKLKLSSINIEKIWHDQYPLMLNSCSQNLTNLTVETCSHLKFLFPYSMVDSLVRLQQLEIRKCESMEAVIDTTDIEINSVEFPSLHHLRIVDCPNLRSFISINSSEEKILHTDTQPLFDEKLVLPRLEVLRIDMMDNMRKIWHHQLALNSFSKLKALEVTNCGKLANIFPANIIMRRRLDRLEYLKVDGCASVEEIIGETSSNGNICMVEEEEEARRSCDSQRPLFVLDPKVAFPGLKELELNKLPNLLHLWKENSQLSKALLNLATLEISECDKLEKLVPSSVSLENLVTLEVSKCNELIHLMTLSTAESLVKLNRMNVIDCKMLQQIILQVGEEVKKDCIVFSQFKYLGLHCLPCLTSFCLGNFTLEFPCLEQVIVRECPKMKIFSQGVLHTPKLQRLHLREKYDEGLWEGSLNSTIQKLFEEMVGYHDKACLSLSKFPHLKEIWHGQALPVSFFINLRWLVVDDCRFMSGAIPANQLQNLINLKTLEVFHLEEQNPIGQFRSLFPKLRNLKLINLPQLIRFCNFTRRIIELPSLVNLWIENCRNMKTFISSSTPVIIAPNKEPQQMTSQENLLADIQPLFDEKKLEKLEVVYCESVQRISELRALNYGDACAISVAQLRETLPICVFSLLTSLKLRSLPRLKCFYPGVHISEWPMLKYLDISGCAELEILASKFLSLGETHVDGQHDSQTQQPFFSFDKVAFPSLKELRLSRLPKLFWLCKETSHPRNVFQNECSKLDILVPSSVSFGNLSTLEVSKCGRLMNLMTISTAERLVNLERMNVTDCKMIQQIIQQVGEVEKDCIVFSQLKYLGLHCLPSLKSFCMGNKALEFPCLEQVIVEECPKMKIFSQGVLHTPKLRRLQLTEEDDEGRWEGNLNSTIQKLFVEMVGFCDLKCLKLSLFPNLKEIWHVQPLPVSFFSNLRSLVIDDCMNFSSAIPANLLRSLNNLEKLEVTNCDSLEEVFHLEEPNADEHYGSLFPKLRKLKLKDLPKLKRFCYFAKGIIELPFLSFMWIESCPNMVTFVSDSTFAHLTATEAPLEMIAEENILADIQPLFNEKVGLPSLEELAILSMDSLRKLWQDELSLHSFYNLKFLGVQKCNKLLNIFPCNMLERLQKLQKLQVLYCSSVREIFELRALSGRDTHTIKAAPLRESDASFVFPQLTSLSLWWLPRLKSFYPQVQISEWPMLKKLDVGGCAEVEIFASEVLSLQETHVDSQHNIQIPQYLFFVDKVAFPSLEELMLFRLPKLLHLWKGNSHPSKVFPNLASLKLSECTKLEKLVPSSVSFQNLTTLEVSKCDGLINLVTCSTAESMGALCTPKLHRLQLTEEDDEGCWDGNLNNTIQQLFKRV